MLDVKHNFSLSAHPVKWHIYHISYPLSQVFMAASEMTVLFLLPSLKSQLLLSHANIESPFQWY